MIKKINITNEITKKSIEIGEVTPPYVLDAVDWGSVESDMEFYKVPYQIGESLSGVSIGVRPINIIGYVIADSEHINHVGMTWEEYYNVQEKQIEESKLKLDKIINVMHDITISAGDYTIVGRPTHSPKYSENYTENNEIMCMFELDITCPDPLFKNNDKEASYTMSNITPLFHFPLVINEKYSNEEDNTGTPLDGIIFGSISPVHPIVIGNNGEARTGAIITLIVKDGTIKNPRIYNVNTGEYIGFTGLSLSKDDTITINTNTGEESVYYHRIGTLVNANAIGYISIGSTFFKVEQGDNIFFYDLEDGNREQVDIIMSFDEKSYNIRGM